MQFNELNIKQQIQRALKDEGYEEATPIQAKAIQPLLEGRDMMGCAQTGTGKTAAFAIPILERLSATERIAKPVIQALILAPTRELAIQIEESFRTYGRHLKLKSTVIYGGVSQNPQTKALESGIDILVATPGRLLDLIHQKYVHLNKVRMLVLDEADQMLDMGMIHDVKKILATLPFDRQTMMFSATMPKEIAKLAEDILKNPLHVEVTPVASTVETIEQKLYHVSKSDKINLLTDLLRQPGMDSALVFSRTKHGANKIVKQLAASGLSALAIHGNKSQNARQLALGAFKQRKVRILVATDVAARGIDIDQLSHVIIYDLPEVPETYVHRIGRTGRAGLEGIAIAFCDHEERDLLKAVEQLIKKPIPVVYDHPYAINPNTGSVARPANKGNKNQRPQNRPVKNDTPSRPARSEASVRPARSENTSRPAKTESQGRPLRSEAQNRSKPAQSNPEKPKRPITSSEKPKSVDALTGMPVTSKEGSYHKFWKKKPSQKPSGNKRP